jgi:hypothetical protein
MTTSTDKRGDSEHKRDPKERLSETSRLILMNSNLNLI